MDTTQIKPIETYYNGYRFRSRLEARWAVFFDAAGIKYQYEPEGYRYTDFDDNEYFYLPDFYLPDFNIWVEVKGNDKALHKDFYKIVNSVDWGRTPMSDGLMILGEIPNPTYFSIPVFPFLYNSKAVVFEYAVFGFDNNSKIKITIRDFGKTNYYWTDTNDWNDENPLSFTTKPLYVSRFSTELQSCRSKKIYNCFEKARQARFEHGEKG